MSGDGPTALAVKKQSPLKAGWAEILQKKKGPGDLGPGPFLDWKSRLHRTSPPFELTRLPALSYLRTLEDERLNIAYTSIPLARLENGPLVAVSENSPSRKLGFDYP